MELALLRQSLEELLPSSQCFALTLYTRLFVMLAFLDLSQDARFLALPFETAQCVFEALVLANLDQRHLAITPL